MFDVEIDYDLYFEPLMNDKGGGITITRRIQLPFVPSGGMGIMGDSIAVDDPEGIEVESAVWDMDRKVFLVDSAIHNSGLPLEAIPLHISFFLEKGWRIGSYSEQYGWYPQNEESMAAAEKSDPIDWTGWDEMQLAAADPKNRSSGFNRFVRALVKIMARQYNNQPTAYAMAQTGRFFQSKPDDAEMGKAWTAWQEARREFEAMPFDQQFEWTQTLGSYPELRDLIKPSIGARQ